MRPTWNAATMVLPAENVSGSTFAWWFLVDEAAQLACVNGSAARVSLAAEAAVAPVSVVSAATPQATNAMAARCVSDRDPTDIVAPRSVATFRRQAPEWGEDIPRQPGWTSPG